jgi:protein-S-isoprenylcysteine O-methyltransferase Ste14
MFILIRALVYATLFVGFLLISVPARLLSSSGLTRPSFAGPVQLAGASLAIAGALVALGCILTFVVIGRGTPAPFDPPRRLVARGPYRFVRNPMYLGAAMAMTGAAVVYASWALMVYAAVFLAITHAFVIGYEEPTLRRTFGADYDEYCATVGRWWPAVR